MNIRCLVSASVAVFATTVGAFAPPANHRLSTTTAAAARRLPRPPLEPPPLFVANPVARTQLEEDLDDLKEASETIPASQRAGGFESGFGYVFKAGKKTCLPADGDEQTEHVITEGIIVFRSKTNIIDWTKIDREKLLARDPSRKNFTIRKEVDRIPDLGEDEKEWIHEIFKEAKEVFAASDPETSPMVQSLIESAETHEDGDKMSYYYPTYYGFPEESEENLYELTAYRIGCLTTNVIYG